MNKKVVLKAQDLDGYLTESDKASLARMDAQYRQAMVSFNILSTAATEGEKRKEEKHLIGLYNDMGAAMQEICSGEKGMTSGPVTKRAYQSITGAWLMQTLASTGDVPPAEAL